MDSSYDFSTNTSLYQMNETNSDVMKNHGGNNFLPSLLAWYDKQETKKETLQCYPVQSCSTTYNLQQVELMNEPLDSDPFAPVDLTPLKVVPPPADDNHQLLDMNVLNSVDSALSIFGNINRSASDIDLLGELQPTPIAPDLLLSGCKKRKSFMEAQPEKQSSLADIMTLPSAKKQRVVSSEGSDTSDKLFRSYQAEQWTEKYEELREYSMKHGNCLVHHTYKKSPALARWVKRQRYQYKLRQEKKLSTMNNERLSALESIGFVWDSHEATWYERRAELVEYREVMGHCNVPSNYSLNQKLAVWVKRQRRQYKFYWEGETSSMTEERIASLEAIGFEWELRSRDSKSKK